MSVVDNDSPISVDITGTFRHGIQNFGGAEVSFGTNPMSDIIWTRSLGCSSVVLVVKSSLNILVQMLNEIVGRLISYIGVLLVKKVVGRDGILDLVLRVVGVFKAVVESSGIGTIRGQFGITVTRFRVVGGMMGNRRRMMIGWGGRIVVRTGAWMIWGWGRVVCGCGGRM